MYVRSQIPTPKSPFKIHIGSRKYCVLQIKMTWAITLVLLKVKDFENCIPFSDLMANFIAVYKMCLIINELLFQWK